MNKELNEATELLSDICDKLNQVAYIVRQEKFSVVENIERIGKALSQIYSIQDNLEKNLNQT